MHCFASTIAYGQVRNDKRKLPRSPIESGGNLSEVDSTGNASRGDGLVPEKVIPTYEGTSRQVS